MQDDPLFRRIRQHAEKRLLLSETQSDKGRLAHLKEFLRLENEMLHRYHQKGDSGLRVTRARSVLIDVLIQSLHAYALEITRDFLSKKKPVSLIATGGYGRGELSPHSDIDLMFLYPKSASGKALESLKETMTREILYPLWDLGMKVGHATRAVKETLDESRRDIRTKNALLDSRYICGDKKVADNFFRKFKGFCKKDNPEGYLMEILETQRARRVEKGGTICLQAPDVKNGAGGLRDFQAVLWMSKVKFESENLDDLVKRDYLTGSEAKSFGEAYSFLLRVRNELHFRSKRPTDILHLEKQSDVAMGLGYEQEDLFDRIETFMGDYYSRARTIRKTADVLEDRLALGSGKGISLSFASVIKACRAKPKKEVDGFQLCEGQLEAPDPTILDQDSERILRLFRHAQQLDAELSPGLRALVRNRLKLVDAALMANPAANVTFRSILQQVGSVGPTLAEMHDLGLLGRFIPEFDRLTCKVQHELYHRYTADVHVLQCIAQLDKVFQGKDETSRRYRDVLGKTEVPALLYLMLFLHDLGKDEGPKGHCERGIGIATSLMERLSIPEEMRDRVLFVIRNHLEMVRYFYKYDLEDPKVIESFAAFVGSEQRLRYLYVHTYCDANGTAPDLWNQHKDDLHHQLFSNTLQVLRGKSVEKDPAALRKSYANLELEDLSPSQIAEQLEQFPNRYFAHVGEEEVALHVSMASRFLIEGEQESIGSAPMSVVEWRDDVRRSLTIVHIVTRDQKGLFEKLAGSFAIAGLNILGSRAFTRSDNIAIDVFFVEKDEGAAKMKDEDVRTIFENTLKEVLSGESSTEALIRERRRKLDRRAPFAHQDRLGANIAPNVDVYRDVLVDRTIVEVRAADQLGLLHLIAKAIADCGLSIAFARIATEHGVANDVFHVETADPEETFSPSRYLELRERLGQDLSAGKYHMEV